MKILLPLFQFAYLEEEFEFSDRRFAIRRFEHPIDLESAEIFAKVDVVTIRHARWALVVDVLEEEMWEEDVSLLLMAFRILATDLSPFIRYKLTENTKDSVRMLEIQAFTDIETRKRELYNKEKLIAVNQAYNVLLNAQAISTRVKNAFYFLYSGFHSTHWIHAFVFMMSTLESLFSKDTPGSATRTICDRVVGLLANPEVSQDDMKNLYNIRSRIVHGDLEANKSPHDNLVELVRIETITIKCFRLMIKQRSFDHYATALQRDNYLKQFDGPPDPMTNKEKRLLEIEQSLY